VTVNKMWLSGDAALLGGVRDGEIDQKRNTEQHDEHRDVLRLA